MESIIKIFFFRHQFIILYHIILFYFIYSSFNFRYKSADNAAIKMQLDLIKISKQFLTIFLRF